MREKEEMEVEIEVEEKAMVEEVKRGVRRGHRVRRRGGER